MNKATNFTSLSKLRPWDPFLIFTLVNCKYVPLKVLSNLSTIPFCLQLGVGSAVYKSVPKSRHTFFEHKSVSSLNDTKGSGGLRITSVCRGSVPMKVRVKFIYIASFRMFAVELGILIIGLRAMVACACTSIFFTLDTE